MGGRARADDRHHRGRDAVSLRRHGQWRSQVDLGTSVAYGGGCDFLFEKIAARRLLLVEAQ